MFKFCALFALIAVASAATVPGISTPLLKRVDPQPEAPANTEHASYVTAKIPISEYVPIRFSLPAVTPLITPLPLTSYAGSFLAYSLPLEAQRFRIAY